MTVIKMDKIYTMTLVDSMNPFRSFEHLLMLFWSFFLLCDPFFNLMFKPLCTNNFDFSSNPNDKAEKIGLQMKR